MNGPVAERRLRAPFTTSTPMQLLSILSHATKNNLLAILHGGASASRDLDTTDLDCTAHTFPSTETQGASSVDRDTRHTSCTRITTRSSTATGHFLESEIVKLILSS